MAELKGRSMRKHRLNVLAAIIVLGVVAASPFRNWRSEAITQDSEERPKGLREILYGLGRDYDCFFTIENGSKEGEVGNKLEVELTRRILEKGGLVRELEQLSQSVPNFSYESNPANSRIVHIIDARLRQQKGYSLDGSLASIDFTGTVNKLPSKIGKQGHSVAAPTGMWSHEHADISTVVEVRGEGLTVRGALSNFVELQGRERILWIGKTKLEPGGVTYVYYP
jgi:hypothetical protein